MVAVLSLRMNLMYITRVDGSTTYWVVLCSHAVHSCYWLLSMMINIRLLVSSHIVVTWRGLYTRL